MRSLFFKIFFSFWISTILIISILALTAETRRSADLHESWRNMFSGVISVNAYIFAQAYENQGCAGLEQQQTSLEQTIHLQSFLFDDNGNALCGPPPNAIARDAAFRAAQSGTVDFTGGDRRRVIAKRIVTAAGHPYRFVVTLSGPEI